MEKNLYILIGVPGSGKSTLAKSIAKSWQIFEADKYFMKNGNYEFDFNGLKDAHNFCKRQVHKAMYPNLVNSLFYRNIVVSNTFTQEWEMKPYFELAEKNGYRVYSLIVENRHDGVNQHGVPADKLEQMKNRFNIKL